MTQLEKIIKGYNNLIDGLDLNISTIDILRGFDKESWRIFITGKTIKYGRPSEQAILNAEYHLKDWPKNQEDLIKLWGYKDLE
jgi:hypothetical protein